MPSANKRSESIRQTARRRIEDCRLAGTDTRHNRAANLQAIQSVVDGDSHYTWNIRGVEDFAFDEILEAIASITSCSTDPAMTSGGGYIAPEATLNAIELAAQKIAGIAERGGSFLLGTGHPGSLLFFYTELARLIRAWGGVVREPARGTKVPPNLEIGYVGGVAVTSDRASLMHSHDHSAMDLMLKEEGNVDLVIADHGYAAGAINASVPVIAVMDTNDPALALAKRLGAELVVVPMDDNRPLAAYLPIVQSMKAFGEYFVPELGSYPEAGETVRERNSASGRIAKVARDVAERYPSQAGLDSLVQGFLASYRDQLVQAEQEAVPPGDWVDDPYRDLVLYARIHDAVHVAIERLVLERDPELDRKLINEFLGIHHVRRNFGASSS